MPIPARNLDDRTYAELVAEAQAMLPHLQPSWTNHNASDPGIMLIELFAWLTEMVLYRLNEVTEKQTELFLELLNGSGWEKSAATDLNTAVRDSLLTLRERHRAITKEDFDYLLDVIWPKSEAAANLQANPIIDRHHCLPEQRLDQTNQLVHAPSHVSIVLLPTKTNNEAENKALIQALWKFLKDRLLLTVQHHLLLPMAKEVSITADLHLHPDVPPRVGLAEARRALTTFFDWRTGGTAAHGWPFGRNVYASELYATLGNVTQIDFITDLQLTAGEEKSEIEIALQPHQLATVELSGLTAVDSLGNRHQLSANQAEDDGGNG